ncbi:ATP-binding cassette domain-containing protein [Actinomyces succiniciruminis]|uniref:ABC transporter, ATP-binding protein n=1 Tax=Actinomyces succiniciruminis TaxID=1522002 RepID=A0A1L7RHP3_9ACTO|nr:ATP-binding cassette domain-containing protein [Actinomyces succiniciruminis]CED91196.1 ABC transporter, ATP-binding protein [Actinomyces succiniciruminis]
MISLSEVSKDYGGVRGLSSASFEVPDGLVACLVGANGAGKTTALKAIGGLVRPDGGEVRVDGAAPGRSPYPLGRLGLVLGADHWVGSRTGFQCLMGIARTSGIPEVRVRQCLEETGIAAVGDRKVRTYSLGMRQRLSLAAAMLGQPQNVVLDEPFNGLDPEGVRWLRSLLRRLADEGRAVLVSSHLLGEVEDIADRVVVLNEGRVLAQAPVDQVRRPGGVIVRADDPAQVVALAHSRNWQVEAAERPGDSEGAVLIDAGIEEVQRAFFDEGVLFTEMREAKRSLEGWFFHVLEGEQEP